MLTIAHYLEITETRICVWESPQPRSEMSMLEHLNLRR
jgi:hypothetical protein